MEKQSESFKISLRIQAKEGRFLTKFFSPKLLHRLTQELRRRKKQQAADDSLLSATCCFLLDLRVP